MARDTMSGATRGSLGFDRAQVITPRGVIDGHVVVAGDRIVTVEPGRLPSPAAGDVEVLDLAGAWLAPGFIDLQINGAFGVDITTEPQRIGEVSAGLVVHGVTSFLPTVITAPAEQRARALAVLATCIADGRLPHGGAVPLGVHLEGPMLSPRRAGAHPVEHLAAPSSALIEGWSAAAGVVLVTLAPELPGALDVLAELCRRGVVVSIGHTDGDAGTFAAARARGATAVTHLFNAMRPFTHRDPGPVGAALADPWVVTGLIADGVHVDPVAVAMAFRSRGPDRLALVTDAAAAMGAPGSGGAPGRLGNVDVVAADDAVRTASGALAGSVCPLDQAVRNLMAWAQCGVPSAVRTVTATPARLLGRPDLGAIEAGARADLVVLDAEARVRATVVGGEIAWRS